MIGKTNVGCKEKALPILTNPAAGGDIISGKQVIDSKGEILTGYIPIAGGQTITPANSRQSVLSSGKYFNGDIVINPIPYQVLGNPASSGNVASGKQFINGSGGVEAGSMPTMGAQTFNPTGYQQVVNSTGHYMTGNIVVNPVNNLAAHNIIDGITIGGVTGNRQWYENVNTEVANDTSTTLVLPPSAGIQGTPPKPAKEVTYYHSSLAGFNGSNRIRIELKSDIFGFFAYETFMFMSQYETLNFILNFSLENTFYRNIPIQMTIRLNNDGNIHIKDFKRSSPFDDIRYSFYISLLRIVVLTKYSGRPYP